MFKNLYRKSVVVSAVGLSSAGAFAAPIDLSTLTAAVDLTTVTIAIIAIGALQMVPGVARYATRVIKKFFPA